VNLSCNIVRISLLCLENGVYSASVTVPFFTSLLSPDLVP